MQKVDKKLQKFYVNKILYFLVFIISKDKFINVDDPEKLLLIYIPIIAEKIDS